MKIFKYLLFLVFLPTFIPDCVGQLLNPHYDKTLSDSLGADDYGMKPYVLVILTTGSVTTIEKDKKDNLFKGHLDNINRLVKDGKLYVAGPLGKNDLQYRGLFILNVKTVEEAKALCDTDPAVKAGLLDVLLIPWYGSAALGEYLKVSEKMGKYRF
jgi:uncharacterized protein YciI